MVHNGKSFNRTNSKELVGKTAVYRRDEPMAFAGYLVRGIVNEIADRTHWCFMNTPQIKQFLQNKEHRGGNINAKEFQAIPPKPTLAQRRFAAIVEWSSSRRSVSIPPHRAGRFFASLQQRAFKGEL